MAGPELDAATSSNNAEVVQHAMVLLWLAPVPNLGRDAIGVSTPPLVYPAAQDDPWREERYWGD
jgi:hypothetical protein